MKLKSADLIQVASKLGTAQREVNGKLIRCEIEKMWNWKTRVRKTRTIFFIDWDRASRATVDDWLDRYGEVE